MWGGRGEGTLKPKQYGSNHLHIVDHVVQSKSEKKTYFLCVGRWGEGGGYCFNGTKSTKGA